MWRKLWYLQEQDLLYVSVTNPKITKLIYAAEPVMYEADM